jgi:hypothetical protein
MPLPGTDAGPGGSGDASSATCDHPRIVCGSTCTSTESDPFNCGRCGVECPPGVFCNMGMCEASCGGGLEPCGSACVDTATDAQHCGGCDEPCESGMACRGGACGCPEDWLECDGECVDPDTDAMHCGVCDRACGGTDICRDGSCTCGASSREDDCGDGEDNDCDDQIDCADSDCTGATRACEGTCGPGLETCSGGRWGECEGGSGGAEICGDGIDQDCDGFDTRMPDAWEPNDTCTACRLLSTDTDPNVFVNARFDNVFDNTDCYSFTASDSLDMESIAITLENIPEGHDYDVYLYRNYEDCESRTWLARGINNENADENVRWDERFFLDDGGTYYVRVTRFTGHSCTENYRLTVNGLRYLAP